MRDRACAPLRRQAGGFSLIELIIVVAIIGVLTSIAWPQYQQYVTDSNRSTCAAKVVELANYMERYFTENQSYQDGGGGPAVTDFIASANCPANQDNPSHVLSITSAATTYTITATATGMQAGNDDCGNLTLDQSGAKGATGSASVADCW